jgi:glycosyltransferase involved in cell wall biosynthesis
MDTRSDRPAGILALLPFLVTGALSLIVLRAMRERGLDITVAFHMRGGGGYTPDPAEDFAAAGRLIDLSDHQGPSGIEVLDGIVRKRRIGLLLQIGSPWAYRQLPYLKEAHPGLRLVDTLYNKIGHTRNHFLYEACLDGVIVESEDMRRYVLDCTAKPDPGVRLVESGIDLERFTPAAPPPRPPGGLVVGYIGRMSPEKNPLGFVDLAEALHLRLPGLSFLMFGEGGMAEEVRARISASPAAGAIRYEGFVDHPSTALAQLDVLVVPSRIDGRPNVVMEANACGVPVLGAPVGGIPELIEPGRNGFVLAPGERDRIAAVLAGWAADPAVLARVRTECRAVAETRFDRRRMLDAYEAVFREFLGEAPP